MKEYRDKELKYLLYLLVFLFLIWCTPLMQIDVITKESGIYKTIAELIGSVLVSGTLSMSVFLFDCLIDSKIKDTLVGLFFIPRAGETIFERIKDNKVKDDRFLIKDAQIKYNDIIIELPDFKKLKCKKRKDYRKFQNSRWYKIYQEHQEKGQIFQAQKDYLLCRDIFVEALFFLLIYIISIFLLADFILFSKKFLIILVFIIIVSNIATHIKMNRFVNTVIAVDIANT